MFFFLKFFNFGKGAHFFCNSTSIPFYLFVSSHLPALFTPTSLHRFFLPGLLCEQAKKIGSALRFAFFFASFLLFLLLFCFFCFAKKKQKKQKRSKKSKKKRSREASLSLCGGILLMPPQRKIIMSGSPTQRRGAIYTLTHIYFQFM